MDHFEDKKSEDGVVHFFPAPPAAEPSKISEFLPADASRSQNPFDAQAEPPSDPFDVISEPSDPFDTIVEVSIQGSSSSKPAPPGQTQPQKKEKPPFDSKEFAREVFTVCTELGEKRQLFVRAGELVIVGGHPGEREIMPVRRWQALYELLSRAGILQAHHNRLLCEAIVFRQAWTMLPPLRAIIRAPLLRPGGQLLANAGYDADTELWLDWVGPPINIDTKVGRQAATAALGRLKKRVETVPFVQELDLAVFLTGLVTTLQAPVLPAKPATGISSPTAGTGKGLVVDLVSLIVTGELAAPFNAGAHGDETDKRLDTALLEGHAILAVDNVNGVLASDRLCSVISQVSTSVRILGQSQSRRVTSPPIWLNGNRLQIIGDLCRRVLVAKIDAQCEAPEDRVFQGAILAEVLRDRGQHISDILAILVAYHNCSKGDASIGGHPLGSFEEWSRTVRDPLVWAGLPDAAQAIKANRTNDPKLQSEAALLALIVEKENLKLGGFRISELIDTALSDHRPAEGAPGILREKLLELTGRPDLQTVAIGLAFAKLEGRIIGGLAVSSRLDRSKIKIWSVTECLAGGMQASAGALQGVPGTRKI